MDSPTRSNPPRTAYPFLPVPFLELLGIKPTHVANGKATLTIEMQPQLRNLYDGFHGGVLMTVFDVAMASAAVSHADFRNTVVTLNISVNFLAPSNGKLTASAEVTGGGKSIVFCDGHIVDCEGKLVATALGSFKYLQIPDDNLAR